MAGPNYGKRAEPSLGQNLLAELAFGTCFAKNRLFGIGSNSRSEHPGEHIMNCETFDVAELKHQIESLQDQLKHPPRSMTHCERLSKMFLLRELETELERVQHPEPELSHY
jgi:hypothetical protein